MWVNEHPPGLHRGWGRGQDRAQGSIHNILQIEFDLDRPWGRVWPAENCGWVHSKSYWSVQRGRKEGVEGGWGVLSQGFLLRGEEAWSTGFRGVMKRSEYGAGGVMEWGAETEVVSVYHFQSGGHSLLPVFIFKRTHPQSIFIMVGLFGHGQFYSLIWALKCLSVSVCSCMCSNQQTQSFWIANVL